ncbi:MAG: hypothetical protein MJ105_09070 [Lachnospiraceae bacterium]|nr:hypothetical protein [Lachnospiraceae bacterium]
MDIKATITDIVNKIKNDPKILEKFQKNPGGTVKEVTGMNIPEDQVNGIVDGVKAKLSADKLGDAANGLKGLFSKKK